MSKLELKKINKSFGSRTIYEDLSYSFDRTGLYALVGSSGCGKSTLLEMIAGLDRDYHGSIRINGTRIDKKNERFLSYFRLKNIGYLRQGYDLLDLEKVLANVSLPIKAVSDESKTIQDRRARDFLKIGDVSNKNDETVANLSGGQKQRVALARSIATSPSILLCDEPTGALDSKNAKRVFECLSEISKWTLVIMVTHDEEAAFKYADRVLKIENRSFFEIKTEKAVSEGHGTFKTKKLAKVKRIPNGFWLKHAFHLCKEKKNRTLAALSILSFSFISLGLAVYMSEDISKEIDRSFASILGNGSLVMQRKGASGETIGKVITAPEHEVREIVENNPEVEDYGTFYFADFDSYFKDLDIVYVDNYSTKIILKGLSIRSINEALWLDDEELIECYPERPKSLEADQVVLGLPYADMFQLCYQLHILRDYEHLGDYIYEHGLNIVFSVSNEDWNYNDEQIISVMGVTPSNEATFYTYDHKWSEYMYEYRMCFPTTDDEQYTLPWMMQKSFYVKPSNTGAEMMRQLRENSYYERFIFEPDGVQYDRSHCKVGQLCGTRRYYVFMADKSSLSYEDIREAEKQSGLSSFLVGTDYSYTSFPNNMMMGFSFPFYATNVRETAEVMLDRATSLNSEQGVTEVLPESVSKGHYVIPASAGLTLSNDFTNLISGYEPKLSSEVAISSALAKRWNNPKTVFLVGFVSQEQVGSAVTNEYRISEVRVTGVVEDSWDRLYVDSFWPIDFFRDELGMSSFLLEPTKCIFEYGKSEISDTILAPAERFIGYEFIDPSSKIAKSTSQVFDYLKMSLSLISVSCFSLALILLFVTVILTILENKKEGRMLFYLGLDRREIIRSLDAINTLITLPSLLMGVATISMMEVFLHKQIGQNFGVETKFSFSFEPILMIVLCGIVSYLLIHFYVRFYVLRRDFIKEAKYE